MISIAQFILVIIIITGLIFFLISLSGISKEFKLLKEAKNIFDPQNPDSYIDNWLIKHDNSTNIALAEAIRLCKRAGEGGRSITITELHSVLIRYEQNKIPPKLMGGIAGLLLIIGIVGTLLGIHDVLANFDLTKQLQAENLHEVRMLVTKLSNAFNPSIIALFGTIFLVSIKGIYKGRFYDYLRSVDSFIASKILTKYRPATISEQFKQVETELSYLIQNINSNQLAFAKTVETLTDNISQNHTIFSQKINNFLTSIVDIDRTAKQFDAVLKAIQNSSISLSIGTSSITNFLNKTLGENSQLHQSVSGFESILERTHARLQEISHTISKLNSDLIVDECEKIKNELVHSLAKHEEALRTEIKEFHQSQKSYNDNSLEKLNELDRLQVLETSAQNLNNNLEVLSNNFIDKIQTLDNHQTTYSSTALEKLKELDRLQILETSAQNLNNNLEVLSNNLIDKIQIIDNHQTTYSSTALEKLKELDRLQILETSTQNLNNNLEVLSNNFIDKIQTLDNHQTTYSSTALEKLKELDRLKILETSTQNLNNNLEVLSNNFIDKIQTLDNHQTTYSSTALEKLKELDRLQILETSAQNLNNNLEVLSNNFIDKIQTLDNHQTTYSSTALEKLKELDRLQILETSAQNLNSNLEVLSNNVIDKIQTLDNHQTTHSSTTLEKLKHLDDLTKLEKISSQINSLFTIALQIKMRMGSRHNDYSQSLISNDELLTKPHYSSNDEKLDRNQIKKRKS